VEHVDEVWNRVAIIEDAENMNLDSFDFLTFRIRLLLPSDVVERFDHERILERGASAGFSSENATAQQKQSDPYPRIP
jgi:hypothetical protein